MEKQKLHIFNKDVYLLGTDKDGIKYFLEEPSWDCGWYWGFGYIETYENNDRPERSKDISSHSHADNFYPKWWQSYGDEHILDKTTFTKDEGWILAELFQNFYFLKTLAEAQHTPNGRIGNMTARCNGINVHNILKDGLIVNRDCLPRIMAKIIAMLSPDENETENSLELKYKNRYNPKE